MHLPMVRPADQAQVVQLRRPAICPMDEVMPDRIAPWLSGQGGRRVTDFVEKPVSWLR